MNPFLELTLKEKPDNILSGLVCYETTDRNQLNNLLISDVLIKDLTYKQIHYTEFEQLVKYYGGLQEDGTIKVTYNRAMYGRSNPSKAMGLYNIRRQIRQTLTKDIYIDIDIVNCHPTILYSILKNNNIECDLLEDYILNRDKYFNIVMVEYNVDKEKAKQLFIRLLYGGDFKKWLVENGLEKLNVNEVILKFNIDMWRINKIIADNNKVLGVWVLDRKKDDIKKKHSYDSTTVAYFLQEKEVQILEQMYIHCINKGYIINNNVSLCADGLMIPKENYSFNILDEFTLLIKDKFNMELKFTKKEMVDFYNDEIISEKINIIGYGAIITDINNYNINFELTKDITTLKKIGNLEKQKNKLLNDKIAENNKLILKNVQLFKKNENLKNKEIIKQDLLLIKENEKKSIELVKQENLKNKEIEKQENLKNKEIIKQDLLLNKENEKKENEIKKEIEKQENLKNKEIIKQDLLLNKENEKKENEIKKEIEKQEKSKIKEQIKLVDIISKQKQKQADKEDKIRKQEDELNAHSTYYELLTIEEKIVYNKCKLEFEKYFFKIEDDIIYCSDKDDKLNFYDFKKLVEYCIDKFNDVFIRKGNKLTTMPFIDVWRDDKDKRKYQSITFNPDLSDKNNEGKYNLFKGFKYADDKIDPVIYNNSKFLQLLKHICVGELEYEYMLEWIAHIIQQPYKKTNVAIVLYSKIGGIGKNAIIDGIIRLLTGYTTKIESIDDICNKFNNNQANKLMIYGDEISARAAKYSDRLKSIITRPELILEKKGFDSITLHDYTNWIFTTNNELAFKIEINSRRMFMINCTDKRYDKQEYIDYYAEIKDDNNINALFNYFLNYKTNKFDIGVACVPDTLYKKKLEYECYSPIIQFLYKNIDMLKDNEYKSMWFYNMCLQFSTDHKMAKISITECGLLLNKILGKYKFKIKGFMVYKFNPDELIIALKNYDINYYNHLYEN